LGDVKHAFKKNLSDALRVDMFSMDHQSAPQSFSDVKQKL
jgi:hypothetical protein